MLAKIVNLDEHTSLIKLHISAFVVTTTIISTDTATTNTITAAVTIMKMLFSYQSQCEMKH
jgi:hypothetical protein